MDCANVRSFGAKGDGTTDDTAAIQAAIATGRARGIPVFIPRTRAHYKLAYSAPPSTITGYHAITPALTVYDDTTILSNGATLKAPTGTGVAMFCDDGTGAARVTFRGLSLDGTSSATEAEHAGIWLGPATDLLVEDCRFLNWGGKGVHTLGVPDAVAQRVRVHRCYFKNAWGNPIGCNRGATDVWITENYIDGSATTSPGEVFVNDDPNGRNQRFHILNNHVNGWGTISVASGTDIDIRGNFYAAHPATTGPGVGVGPSSRVRIAGNHLDMTAASSGGATGIAFVVDGNYSDIAVNGNTIVRPPPVDSPAVLVQLAGTISDVAVKDNHISGGPVGTEANTCPIVLKALSGPLHVTGNTVTSPHRHSVFITGGTPTPLVDTNETAGAILCDVPEAIISNNRVASDQQAIEHADRCVVTGNRVVSGNSYGGTGAIATYGANSIVANNVIENTVADMPWIYEHGGDYNKFGPNICIGTNGSVHVVGAHSTQL